MTSSEYQVVKGYMSNYKKLLFCEHEMAMTVLEIQHHFDLTLSHLDSRMDDVETNTRVLTREVNFVEEEMRRMEYILVKNFNGMRNCLGNMRSYLIGLVEEAKERSVLRENRITIMIEWI